MANMPFFSAIHRSNAPASEHRIMGSPFELPLWYLPFNNAGRYSSVARLFHAPSAPIASQFRSVAVCKGAQTATTLAKVSFQPFLWPIQPDRVLAEVARRSRLVRQINEFHITLRPKCTQSRAKVYGTFPAAHDSGGRTEGIA